MRKLPPKYHNHHATCFVEFYERLVDLHIKTEISVEFTFDLICLKLNIIYSVWVDTTYLCHYKKKDIYDRFLMLDA